MGSNEVFNWRDKDLWAENINQWYSDGIFQAIENEYQNDIKIVDFKESGKFIYAYSDSYSQSAYYLSSVADKVFLNPEGTVMLTGFSAGVMFYKDLLDKLGIKISMKKYE